MDTKRRIKKLSEDKFINDTQTVLKFIQLYCDDKHQDKKKEDKTQHLSYENKDLHVDVKYHLCETCIDTFLYSYKALQECPHEKKPSCRKCPAPCYDRPRWKKLASIMKYSGMRLGLTKIKLFFSSKS